ncbi:MAG: NAD(P)-dependent oxidoreductase [Bacteroidetes bacterium]|jgi:predicted homoserine dehydrogenase-like protein|nr:NAD(P)-dependent oxidoreductase [Bacteroidota bacterium]
MYIIDNKLKEREKANNPIRVGVIGAGEMAKGLINQINRYTPGMVVAATYSRTLEKIEKAYQVADIKNYKKALDKNTFDSTIKSGQSVITETLQLLLESDQIDVVVEMTGQIQFGLEAIMGAFKAKKHVMSFNAELEAILGPYLKKKAEEYGVMYTLGDGDQPGVTANLYRYVKLMGFTPVLCGNVKGMLDFYRTPATQKAFAEKWGMNPVMATNFADGTKVNIEQACIANYTGMTVAQRGMIALETDKHVDELTGEYDVDMLVEKGGIVEMVIGAKPGPGVYVYATSNDDLSTKYLEYGKLGKGPLYSFYQPYHLLFFELAFSIARLIDFQDVTLDAAHGMKVEVISAAKEDLKPGDTLDGIGGFKAYGLCEVSELARKENLLPIGLSHGAKLKNPVKKDHTITFDDVEIEDNYLLNCFNEQF